MNATTFEGPMNAATSARPGPDSGPISALRDLLGGAALEVVGGPPATPAPAASIDAVMDGVYRHQRHIYDLTRKYFLLGRGRVLPPPRRCGSGR